MLLSILVKFYLDLYACIQTFNTNVQKYPSEYNYIKQNLKRTSSWVWSLREMWQNHSVPWRADRRTSSRRYSTLGDLNQPFCWRHKNRAAQNLRNDFLKGFKSQQDSVFRLVRGPENSERWSQQSRRKWKLNCIWQPDRVKGAKGKSCSPNSQWATWRVAPSGRTTNNQSIHGIQFGFESSGWPRKILTEIRLSNPGFQADATKINPFWKVSSLVTNTLSNNFSNPKPIIQLKRSGTWGDKKTGSKATEVANNKERLTKPQILELPNRKF